MNLRASIGAALAAVLSLLPGGSTPPPGYGSRRNHRPRGRPGIGQWWRSRRDAEDRADSPWPLERMDAGQRQAVRAAMRAACRATIGLAGRTGGQRKPTRLRPETRESRGPAGGPCGAAKRRFWHRGHGGYVPDGLNPGWPIPAQDAVTASQDA